jgi:hypothetical protein
MVFISTTADAPTICATMAQALAVTDDWEEADSGYTAGNAVKHIPSGTFVAFKVASMRCSTDADSRSTGAGIQLIFSSEWDMEAHVPSGSIRYGAIVLSVSTSYTDSVPISTVSTPNVMSARLHIDRYGIIGNIVNTATNGVGQFISLEAISSSAQEYDDGNRPIFFTALPTITNVFGRMGGSNSVVGVGLPNTNGISYLHVRGLSLTTNTTPISTDYLTPSAYRSTGNNKVMLEFPILDAVVISGNYRAPIFRTYRWFKVASDGGLAVGDIINWLDSDNVTIHKFIVVDIAQGNLYAIPYENPFDYSTLA